MDIGTVLQIIEMIDARIKQSADQTQPFTGDFGIYTYGYRESLRELRNHLQEYIEYQISAMENQLEE